MFKKVITCCLLFCATAWSQPIHVAVASNFAAPIQKITSSFEQDTGYKLSVSIGSTGKFYTQIKSGAPYLVLLAADEDTPARLEREGFAVTGSSFTYASGKLILWSKDPNMIDDKGQVLLKGNFEHIAMADPKLAPYGLAAKQTLEKLGLYKSLSPKVVRGENIGQTFLFVNTGSVRIGFVAMSQVMRDGRIKEGSAWIVPTDDYSAIKQNATLLKIGEKNIGARSFLEYLKSTKALGIMKTYGYD